MARAARWSNSNSNARLANYGLLFLGEDATAAYGDKYGGSNHDLPALGAHTKCFGVGESAFGGRIGSHLKSGRELPI